MNIKSKKKYISKTSLLVCQDVKIIPIWSFLTLV